MCELVSLYGFLFYLIWISGNGIWEAACRSTNEGAYLLTFGDLLAYKLI